MSGLVHCLYSGHKRTPLCCGVQLSWSSLEDNQASDIYSDITAASDIFPHCIAFLLCIDILQQSPCQTCMWCKMNTETTFGSCAYFKSFKLFILAAEVSLSVFRGYKPGALAVATEET